MLTFGLLCCNYRPEHLVVKDVMEDKVHQDLQELLVCLEGRDPE